MRLAFLSALPFLPPSLRTALAPELTHLLAVAASDDDAFVAALAAGLAGLTEHGRLDLAALAAGAPSVRHGRRARLRARE